LLQPDVISLHNIHASNDNHELVVACAQIAPVVWTLHDMWSFTGRCAHSNGCEKFVGGCDASCPSPHVRPALQPSKISKAWKDRRRFFENNPNIIGISPSMWLASLAKKGLWQHHRLEVIHNGVDTNVFKPIHQNSARESLGLPIDGFVMTAYVGHKDDPFKTPELLETALYLVELPVHVLTFGPGSLNLPARHTVTALGSIGNPRFLSIAYSCGDIFVLPSTQENFPTVILEAAACGVPTVAFGVGGNPEIVREGETGWLANTLTAAALAETITLGLEKAHRNGDMREQCRKVAVNNFNVSKQAALYQSLFQELVSGSFIND
jgi:glycosyltransferase involved in cell wall biosynthesis